MMKRVILGLNVRMVVLWVEKCEIFEVIFYNQEGDHDYESLDNKYVDHIYQCSNDRDTCTIYIYIYIHR